MEKISKYRAIDGVEFYSETECLNYENLIKRVDEIMGDLHPRPKDELCEFSNGGGFIQHDKSMLRRVQINLLEEIKNYIDHEWIQQTIDDENVHPSYVDRLVGEYNISPLNKAWHRFVCIDRLGREWGQPYYASNPDKADQFCIN